MKIESSSDKHPIFFTILIHLQFVLLDLPCRYAFVLSFLKAVIGWVIGGVSGGVEYQQCVRYQHSLLDLKKVISSVCIELFRLFIFNYNIIILIMYFMFCL